MSCPDEELLRLVSDAFDEGLGEPPAHLTEAAKALRRRAPGPADPDPAAAGPGSGASAPGPAADAPGDELAARRVHRLYRHLAAAAASASRHLGATLASGDGSIVTEVSENDEGQLQVTVRSDDPEVLYVALAWTPILPEGAGRRFRLVTPLAPDRRGVSVRYDLGSVTEADAVDIEAAEAVAVTDVGPEDVRAAFALVPTGASRRAWARAGAIHWANGDSLAEAIERGLSR